MRGIIKGFHKPTGQIVTPEQVYNFNVDCVNGSIQNNQEVDFMANSDGLVTSIDTIRDTTVEETITEELLLEEEEDKNGVMGKERSRRRS
jgi:hypothetical protein|tara:strand:+ start:616 stop:885 length:270 start_codon:yes stop_codon:yes gene_type:complete